MQRARTGFGGAMATGALAGMFLAAEPLAAQMPPPREGAVPQWWERTTQRRDRATSFEMRGDLDPARVRALLDDAALLRQRLARVLAWLPPAQPEPRGFWLFATRRDFEDTLRARAGVRAGDAVALRLPGRVEHAIALCDSGVSIDATHAALRAAVAGRVLESRLGRAAPPWFEHGFPRWAAQSTLPGGARWSPGAMPPLLLASLQEASEAGRWIGAERLLALDAAGWAANLDGPSAALVEAQAAALVAFLVENPADAGTPLGWSARLRRLLEAIRLARTPEAARSESFGDLPPGALDQAWRAWLAEQRSPALLGAIEEATVLAEAQVRQGALPTAGAIERLRALLQEGEIEIRLPAADPGGSRRWRPTEQPQWEAVLLPVEPGREEGPSVETPRVIWQGTVRGTPDRVEVRWFEPEAGSLRYEVRVLPRAR